MTQGDAVKLLEIPNSAIKYILFQRTGYLRNNKNKVYVIMQKAIRISLFKFLINVESVLYRKSIKIMYSKDMENEYLSIKDVLPIFCNSILDIGCGVAGVDCFLGEHYEKKPDIFLLDKTKTEKNIWYNLNNKGAFYNSLDISKRVLIENEIPQNKIHVIEATQNNDIEIEKNIDLVISLISWGYHYPVDIYLSQVYDLLSDGGVVILDIRKGTNGIQMINAKFGNHLKILDRKTYTRILVKKSYENAA